MHADRELTKGFSLNERLLGAKTPSKEGFVSFDLVEEESEKGDVQPPAVKVLYLLDGHSFSNFYFS
jgi:hypothetical protein